MGSQNELVAAYESAKRKAQSSGNWKLKLSINWMRWRLKRTGREIIRIQVLALENELNHRPLADMIGQRRPARP